MFGMGIGEIILIAVIAIVVLGPDKLPTAMVEIVKFFKSVKQTVTDAKSTIDNELNITELKESAKEYQRHLDTTREEMTKTLGVEEAKKEMENIQSMFRETPQTIAPIGEPNPQPSIQQADAKQVAPDATKTDTTTKGV